MIYAKKQATFKMQKLFSNQLSGNMITNNFLLIIEGCTYQIIYIQLKSLKFYTIYHILSNCKHTATISDFD